MMNRLLAIGFEHAGNWSFRNGQLAVNLLRFGEQNNALYSFLEDGEVRYVGKTIRTLRQRMYGYLRPGSTQLTNVRVNRLIVEALQQGRDVEILVLPDSGLMHYGQFHLNLAAGLEDSIIAMINPPWNGGERKKSIEQDDVVAPVIDRFQFELQPTYYERGFFNVPVAHSSVLGDDGQKIDVFGGDSQTAIIALLNRRSNANGTPRIMGGAELRNWFKSTCQLGGTVDVDVYSPVVIRLNATNH